MWKCFIHFVLRELTMKIISGSPALQWKPEQWGFFLEKIQEMPIFHCLIHHAKIKTTWVTQVNYCIRKGFICMSSKLLPSGFAKPITGLKCRLRNHLEGLTMEPLCHASDPLCPLQSTWWAWQVPTAMWLTLVFSDPENFCNNDTGPLMSSLNFFFFDLESRK